MKRIIALALSVKNCAAKWFFTGLFATAFISAGMAAGLAIQHTAFPTADNSTEFGIPAAVENTNTVLQTNMLSKVVVVNQSSSAYQVPSNTAYVIFAGTNTNAATFTVSMPSATNSLDNQEVTLYGQAAVSAVTAVSSGGSVVGAPSNPTSASWHAKYKFDAGTTTWWAVDN